MICDEVMCGLGRTGEWFAVDGWGVVPDILTMAKGVTSAYLPLGVVAISPEIAASFNNRPFVGGLTYSGHPMCLAVAVATLRVFEDEQIVPHAKQMGVVMAAHLERLRQKHPSVGDSRSVGLFGAMELVKNKATKEPLVPYNGSHPAVEKMTAFLKQKGLYSYVHWNIVHTIPPLVITEEQLDEAFAIFDEALYITDEACDP